VPVLVLAIVIALVDQGIKYYVQSQMTLGMSIPVINGVFHITYILNPGAAADVAIVTGVGLLMYTMLFFPESLPGRNPGRPEKES
jgi:signal peptidase II